MLELLLLLLHLLLLLLLLLHISFFFVFSALMGGGAPFVFLFFHLQRDIGSELGLLFLSFHKRMICIV